MWMWRKGNNDARCFISVHTRWRSKYHHTWQNASTVLSRIEAFSVSGTIAVSGFTRLWSFRGLRQIVEMERKEFKLLYAFNFQKL